MMQKSVPSENLHAAFWHTFSNDAQALFSIQTTREQGLAYKGKSTDEGYGYRMPIYWTFKLLSEQRGEFLVESRLQGNNSIDAPKTGLYFDPQYAFARVTQCASLSDNRLYVALLNKDAHQTVETRITIQDWRTTAAVEVHEVRADSYLAENTIERPDTVKLADPQTLPLAQTGTLTYRLKPNSLVVLRFESARNE